MPMMSKVELAVRELVAKESGLQGAMEVPLDKTLYALAIEDGTDPEFLAMYIRFGLEDMLSISVPDTECAEHRTVHDLVKYMEARYRIA